jgi:hypothetical protein
VIPIDDARRHDNVSIPVCDLEIGDVLFSRRDIDAKERHEGPVFDPLASSGRFIILTLHFEFGIEPAIDPTDLKRRILELESDRNLDNIFTVIPMLYAGLFCVRRPNFRGEE